MGYVPMSDMAIDTVSKDGLRGKLRDAQVEIEWLNKQFSDSEHHEIGRVLRIRHLLLTSDRQCKSHDRNMHGEREPESCEVSARSHDSARTPVNSQRCRSPASMASM